MGFAGWYSSDLTMEHPNIICQATVQSFVINKRQKNRVDKSENWMQPHRGVSHWYGEIKGPGCCVYSPAAINAQISSSLLCFLVFVRDSIAGSPSSCIFCRFPVGILDFFLSLRCICMSANLWLCQGALAWFGQSVFWRGVFACQRSPLSSLWMCVSDPVPLCKL